MRFLKFLTFALGALGLVVLTGRAPVEPPRPKSTTRSRRAIARTRRIPKRPARWSARRPSSGPARASCGRAAA